VLPQLLSVFYGSAGLTGNGFMHKQFMHMDGHCLEEGDKDS